MSNFISTICARSGKLFRADEKRCRERFETVPYSGFRRPVEASAWARAFLTSLKKLNASPERNAQKGDSHGKEEELAGEAIRQQRPSEGCFVEGECSKTLEGQHDGYSLACGSE